MQGLRSLFVPHGGGPLPLMGDPSHQQMVDTLTSFMDGYRPPKAILLVSAHWEEEIVTIASGAAPELIYDYSGFPPETYSIRYPAPGDPVLAQQVHDAISQVGIPAQLDEKRGYDHGAFVPLKIMFPEARIPVVQVSLHRGLSPQFHLQIGQALSGIANGSVMLMGSGFTFHNMRAFFTANTPQIEQANVAFEAWLREAVSSPLISDKMRREKLIHWDQAPSARFCHPREEHLLPLHVCVGVSHQPADIVVPMTIAGKQTALYGWTV